VDEDQCWT